VDTQDVDDEEEEEEEEEEDRPQTPPPGAQGSIPHRSPGGVSEMSGTTAISSLSQLDAEDLDPEEILEHIDELYSASKKFLGILVPDNGKDADTVKGLRMPGSRLSERFRAREEVLNMHLEVFRKSPQQYIRRPSILRALLGEQGQPSVHIPAELIIYKANLVVFAKQMITSQREHKPMWDTLRQLDMSLFPILFLSGFEDKQSASSHSSALLSETFALGLDIRTQLAITVLQNKHASNDGDWDPDEMLNEVFYNTQGGPQMYRGWEVNGLGADGTDLPRQFQNKIRQRIEEIRNHFTEETQQLEEGDFVDFESLTADFDWDKFIHQVLNWARLRNREIETKIKEKGGIDDLVETLKDKIMSPTQPQRQSVDSGAVDSGAVEPGPSPKKPRTSFGAERRRSRRSYDPEKA